VIYSYNKSQQDALFLNFILLKNSICFGEIYCPSSGILLFKYTFSMIYFTIFLSLPCILFIF